MTGIVVDSSALIALALREANHHWLNVTLTKSHDRWITAPNALELSIVLEGRLADSAGLGGRVLREFGVSAVAFTPEMADRGMHAWRRFGKGRHPAALNFGDCCTYALAEETGWPILCIGDDFARTGWDVLRPNGS